MKKHGQKLLLVMLLCTLTGTAVSIEGPRGGTRRLDDTACVNNKPTAGEVEVLVFLIGGSAASPDAYIPRISGYCVGTTFYGASNRDPIKLRTDVNQRITMTFQLDKKIYPTVQWAPDGSASGKAIWMVNQTGVGNPRHPTQYDWPCGARKAQANNLVIDMCPYSGTNTAQTFEYALHLVETGSDGVPVDLVIDPQIINHPSNLGPQASS